MKENKNKRLLRYIEWRSKENTMQYLIGTYPIFVYKIHEHADKVGVIL